MIDLSFIEYIKKKYKVDIVFLPTERQGYLLNNHHSKPKIVVNSSLSENDVKSTVLHEIGHLIHDSDVVGDYKEISEAHYSSESAANKFMIQERIREYVLLGNDAIQADWLKLAKGIGTNQYKDVKKELRKYMM